MDNSFEEERFVRNADKFFSGPEHEYQLAISCDEYRADRRQFLDIVWRVADKDKIKATIADDYKKWRKFKWKSQ